MFGRFFALLVVAGLISLILVALSPFIFTIFGEHTGGGSSENCNPSIYATVNAC